MSFSAQWVFMVLFELPSGFVYVFSWYMCHSKHAINTKPICNVYVVRVLFFSFGFSVGATNCTWYSSFSCFKHKRDVLYLQEDWYIVNYRPVNSFNVKRNLFSAKIQPTPSMQCSVLNLRSHIDLIPPSKVSYLPTTSPLWPYCCDPASQI